MSLSLHERFFVKVRCLRQIVLAGLGDHVARRIITDNMNTEDKQRLRYAYQVRIQNLLFLASVFSPA